MRLIRSDGDGFETPVQRLGFCWRINTNAAALREERVRIATNLTIQTKLEQLARPCAREELVSPAKQLFATRQDANINSKNAIGSSRTIV